jgi:hypothetical protein
MVSGDAPIMTSPEVVWDNLTVPAGGVKELTFRAQIPYQIEIEDNETSTTYKNSLSASVPGLIICDMWFGTWMSWRRVLVRTSSSVRGWGIRLYRGPTLTG